MRRRLAKGMPSVTPRDLGLEAPTGWPTLGQVRNRGPFTGDPPAVIKTAE